MAKIYLDATSTDYTVSNSNDTVAGIAGTQAARIGTGATGLTFDQNVERVIFAGASSDYTFLNSGNTLKVLSGSTIVATIPVQDDVDGTQLTFSNGTANAIYASSVMKLGGATVDATTAVKVTPTTLDKTVVSGTVTTPVVSTSTTLTTNQDNLTGSTGDDIFKAYIFNNSNTLQSGDAMNGGTGVDTLSADIGNSQTFAITPETINVETAAFRAQTVSSDATDNNTARTSEVQIDAQRMVGVTRWESNNSRADLLVEDVRILPGQITKDITIAMVETDPGNVDFGVYFDQYSLKNQTASSSSLSIQLMDTRSLNAGLDPLKESPYNGFTFKVGGVTQTVSSDAIDAAQTYAQLLKAIQDAVAANTNLAGFTVTMPTTFTARESITGNILTGNEIVLTSNDSAKIITTDATTGWTVTGAVPSSSAFHTVITPTISSSTDLVTSKIILDDVGRGSTGGDLVVGGLSVGDTSTSNGVQRFEIEVLDNSKLQTINSTNNTLREVTIKNGLTSSSSFAYVTTTKDSGNLTVNGSLSDLVGTVISGGTTVTDAAGGIDAALPGTETVNGGDQHNAFGFSDVRLIDGSAMTGQLAFTAEITDASIAKYLNLVDVSPSVPTADNIAFVYSGGSNNDTMAITIDAGFIGSTSSLTGREDFTFTANGGAGNDVITTNIGEDESNAWYVDQKQNANMTINGDAGNDTITTTGAGDVKINAGAGNDTVYADNSGAVATMWAINDATPATPADLWATSSARGFLYNGKLTVSFTGAGDAGLDGGVTSGPADSTAANFTNGFEKVVDIPTGSNYAVTQLYINQAIKLAINSDPVLSKVLLAQDGPANTLTITSLIDGNFNANDLKISVTSAALNTYDLSQQALIVSAYKLYSGISTADITAANTANTLAINTVNGVAGMDVNQVLAMDAGAASAAESDNTINPGTGDDVIVLGTGAFSNDTVVFTGYGLGKNTIINFEDNTADTAYDMVNFNSYLIGKASLSGSVESQKTIPTTINTTTPTVLANSVNVINGAFTALQTFDGLTDSFLLAAINSSNTAGLANYAGITDGTLNAMVGYTSTGVGTTLVGGQGHAVVLIQNNLNEGEYKMFDLTFDGMTLTNAVGNFSAATLIGTVDFGNTVNFGTNVTTFAATAGAAAAAGGGGVVAPPVVVPPVGTPTLSIAGPASLTEGAAPGTYTVTLSAASTTPVTVAYATTFGTTATVADLVGSATAGTLTFAAGVTTQTINIGAATDAVTPETGENIVITLSAPSAGAALGTTTSVTTALVDVAPAAGGTVAVTVNAAATLDASLANNAYAVTVGSTYTANISGFAALDTIKFDAGTAIGVTNSLGTDGIIDVVGTLGGFAVTIHLTGVALASDAAVFGVSSFNTAFGAGSLA